MVHGLTSAGSESPWRVIDTAQPSSFSFLITRAIQPAFFHSRGSDVSSITSSIPRASPTGMTSEVAGQDHARGAVAGHRRDGHAADEIVAHEYALGRGEAVVQHHRTGGLRGAEAEQEQP